MSNVSDFELMPTDEPHMAKVPAKQAACLRAVCGGTGYDAIARELNVPVGTVKSRVHRGRAKILKLRAAAAAAAPPADTKAA